MVARVRTVADQLGYRPDITARMLRTKRTYHLGFAVADIGNPVYVEMMRAIHSVVAPDGFHVVVMSSGDSVESTARLVESLDNGLVDGLIISPLWTNDALIEGLGALRFPTVLIGPAPADSPIDSVGTDSAAGIRLAVAHLAETGRRRLAFLNGPLDTTAGSNRQRGFEQAASDPTLGVETAGMTVAGDFTVSAGRTAAATLLDTRDHVDAIVAANDLLAIGCFTAAHDRGLEVPADIGVTGMDDTEFAHVYSPSITSVSLGAEERGRRAAELLLARIEDPARPPRRVVVPPHLVIGRSTAVEGPAA
jgi:LacI family transcriptional regulator